MRFYFLFCVFSIGISLSLISYSEIESIGFIDIISLVIFFISLFFSLINYKYFIFFLVFNIIAMPSAVNNFIPGVNLGYEFELGAATMPLFTFFDLFCFLGILRYKLVARFNNNYLIIFLIIGCILVFTVNGFYVNDTQELLLLISGFWQLRYILHLFIITQNISKVSFNLIYNSIIASTFFLIMESIIFTNLSGLSNLTSGSLGVNSFGNFLSAVVLFAIFSRKKIDRKKLKINMFYIIFIFICVYLTDTRSAILSGLLIGLFFWLKTKTFSKAIIVATVLLFSYNSLPLKYKIFSLLTYSEAQEIIEYGYDFESKGVSVTPENSPIISRFNLFRTSSNMINNNFLFGIGPKLWNKKKYDYGYNQFVLIDSHNGYLSFLSEYGVFVGLIFIWLFIYPLINSNIEFKLYPLIAFNYVFLLTEFSNSGTYKFQIFSILFLSSLILYKNKFFSSRTLKINNSLKKH